MKKILLFLMLALFCIPWVANAQQALPYSYGFEDGNLATDGWETVAASYSGIIGTDEDYGIYPHSGSYLFLFTYDDAEDAGEESGEDDAADGDDDDISFFHRVCFLFSSAQKVAEFSRDSLRLRMDWNTPPNTCISSLVTLGSISS